MNLPSLHTMLLAKWPYGELQDALCTVILLHTALLLIKLLHSKRRAESVADEIHWSYQVPYYPEAAGLIEQWNDLLNTWLQCWVGDNALQAGKRFFRRL